MSENKYFVRARYNHKTRYIHFPELNVDSFLKGFVVEFKIPENTSRFSIADNLDAPLNRSEFPTVLKRYGDQASFFINVAITEPINHIPVVTVNALQEYLAKEYAEVLNMRDKHFDNNQINRLMRHIQTFAIKRFGDKPSNCEQEAIALAVNGLFPKIKKEIIRNSNDGGKLGIGLRYKRFKANKKRSVGSIVPADPGVINVTDEFELLKSTMVNNENMATIKLRLARTLQYRTTLLRQIEINLLECFPYFFVSAELISYDFAIRYPNVKDDAFESAWQAYSQRIVGILENHYKKTINLDWSNEAIQLLAFYKMLPAKVTQSNMLTVEEFSKVIDKLIVFREEGCALDKLIEEKNSFPYIIAVGRSKKEITHYYIEVERELMNVPINLNIGQAFDLFFKVHKIFQMNADPNIERLFKFCEHFIYEIHDSPDLGKNDGKPKRRKFKPTTAMIGLFDLLNPKE